jgi:hypothetical protein
MRLYVQLNNKDDVEKVSQIIKDAMLPHIDEASSRNKAGAFPFNHEQMAFVLTVMKMVLV